jgi:hypothetical protein
MKRVSIAWCYLVMIIFSYVPFSYGYSMADYWAIKAGQVGIYDQEIIVVGPETKTFGPYSGREYLQADDYSGDQAFVYTGPAGVMVVGFYDSETSSYVDISAYPLVISKAQMNVGETISSTVPPGVFDPDYGSVFTITLVQEESITVPAGTFSNSLKLKVYVQEGDGRTYTEYIWLVRDIGPVQMFRESETNNYDGCFLTCGSDRTGERYTKLKSYIIADKTVVLPPKVVVIPLLHR